MDAPRETTRGDGTLTIRTFRAADLFFPDRPVIRTVIINKAPSWVDERFFESHDSTDTIAVVHQRIVDRIDSGELKL